MIESDFVKAKRHPINTENSTSGRYQMKDMKYFACAVDCHLLPLTKEEARTSLLFNFIIFLFSNLLITEDISFYL